MSSEKDRLEELEQRIADLEENTVVRDELSNQDKDNQEDGGENDDSSVGRRDVLAGGAGLLGLGGLVSTMGQARAAGPSGDTIEIGTNGEGTAKAGQFLLADTSSSPANAGQFRRNGSDVEVHSGGTVKNLSNIGSGGGSSVWSDGDSDGIYTLDSGSGISVDELSSSDVNQVYVPGQGNYGTIQAAVDAMATATSGTSLGDVGLGEVKVPAIEGANSNGWEETIDFTENASSITGQGVNTRIAGSGDHTLDLQATDVHVDNLWIDQTDTSGSYDAVNAANEAVFTRLDLDRAPRHALNIDHKQVQGSDIRILDYGIYGIGINFDANSQDCQFSDVNIDGLNNNLNIGLAVINGADSVHISSCHIQDTQDNGVFWGGDNGHFEGAIENAGNNGLNISDANNNTFRAVVKSATSNALDIGGTASNNVIIGHFAGDVFLGSNTSNNTLIGSYTGSLTDQGTGNDTSMLN